MPLQGTEEMNVSLAVRVVQEFKEVVNGKSFTRGCPWVGGWEPGLGGGFRLGRGGHGLGVGFVTSSELSVSNTNQIGDVV